jgi:hypothetical protein
MSMIRRMNPTPGVMDFWSEFKKPTPYRWPILGVSSLMTFGLMYLFTGESVLVPPAPPEVTYIESFAANRDDAEIIASNIENQRNQNAIAALMKQGEERKRELYRTLGRASGMDVEEIERKADAERAEIAAAEEARKADVRRRAGLPQQGETEEVLRARAREQAAATETTPPETTTRDAPIETPGQ